MDISKYTTREVFINSTKEVDNILAKLVEIENLKSGVSNFDFQKFDLEIRLLIKKAKLQVYFIEECQKLRKLYPQRASSFNPTKANILAGKPNSITQNTPSSERKHTQISKQQLETNVSSEIFSRFIGESIESVSAFCKVKPRVLIEILRRKSLQIDNPKSTLNLNQLTALRSYLENRLSIIERSDRKDKKLRSSESKIDKSSNPKGSVFIIPTQIRN